MYVGERLVKRREETKGRYGRKREERLKERRE
jgi:hypothetical protein